MKTFFIKNIFIVSFIILLLGCSEDFLKTDPQGSVAFKEYYKTDNDAMGATWAVYDILQSLYAQDWTSMWMLKSLQADEMFTGGGQRGDQPPYEELNEFRYGSSNSIITWTFQTSYWGVYRANLVINNVKPESEIKKRSIAEAKTLRALLYFDLVTLWGKVPLVLDVAKTPGEYNKPRAEVAEVWAQIEKDLQDAIVDLPLRSKYSGADLARVSLGTAQALLGKAYLYQGKYAAAAAEFQKIIDSKEYELNTDYAKILRIASEFGKESLFEISYANDMNYTWGNFQWGNNGRNAENNIHWQLCGPRGDGWFDGGKTGLVAGWGFCYPTDKLYQAFVSANDTCRLRSSILSEADLIAKGGKLRNADKGNTLPWGCEGYVRLKYGPYAAESITAEGSIRELNYGTNIRMIRYADVLLMAAEAYNKSGDDGKALGYLNEVRKRAKLSDATESGAALFDKIVAERQLELAFEGVRFQDLKRWGMAKTVLANQGKLVPKGDGTYLTVDGAGFKDKNMLLPIPEQEMSVNPLAAPNNDGY
jgi:tetratricopeptide (TPR) repeat protein